MLAAAEACEGRRAAEALCADQQQQLTALHLAASALGANNGQGTSRPGSRAPSRPASPPPLDAAAVTATTAGAAAANRGTPTQQLELELRAAERDAEGERSAARERAANELRSADVKEELAAAAGAVLSLIHI